MTVSALHPSYRVADGCWNCAHRFERHDYENHDTLPFELYCNITKDRPKCGSARMFLEESIQDRRLGRRDPVAWQRWLDWSKPRAVQESGWCEMHAKEDPGA